MLHPLVAAGWAPASEDWCEPNFLHSRVVAEAFNTLSSVPIVLAAGYATVRAARGGAAARCVLPSALMTAVGVGSCAFHGTLTRAGQAADELPMVYAAAALLYATLRVGGPAAASVPPALAGAALPAGLAAFCAAFTAVYFTAPGFFAIFVGLYIALVLALFARCCAVYASVRDAEARGLLVTAAAAYFSGFLLLWLPDKFACSSVQPYSFHAWFHLTSTLGPVYCMAFVTHATHAAPPWAAPAAPAEGAGAGGAGGGGTPRRSTRRAAAAAAAGADAAGKARRAVAIEWAAGVLPVVVLA